MRITESKLRRIIRNVIKESFGLTKLGPELENKVCNKLKSLDLDYLKYEVDNPDLVQTSFLLLGVSQGDVIYCDPSCVIPKEEEYSALEDDIQEKREGIYIVVGFAEDLYENQAAGGAYSNISPSKSDREHYAVTMYVADEYGRIFEVLLDESPLIEKVSCV